MLFVCCFACIRNGKKGKSLSLRHDKIQKNMTIDTGLTLKTSTWLRVQQKLQTVWIHVVVFWPFIEFLSDNGVYRVPF